MVKESVLVKKASVSHDIREILANEIRNDLVITPVLNEFLETWDERVSPRAAKHVARMLMKADRDRRGSWSASGAGNCLRRQELQFLGMPVSGRTSYQLGRIFDNGTWVHYRWQAVLMTAGILDQVEVLVKKPSLRARCSMDGVGTARASRFEGLDFGFELKGRNDWEYRKQTVMGVDEKTRKQVDFEFLLSGFDVFVIVNENKNTQAIKEWVFYREDDRINEMHRQLIDLNRAIDRQRLHPMLPECKAQDPNGEFAKCPFGGPGGACLLAGKWPRKTGI